MLVLKQPLILLFLCHKSATACQIDSNKASNSKLKPDLCKGVRIEIIETTAPPQYPHKWDTIILGHPVHYVVTSPCTLNMTLLADLSKVYLCRTA